MNKITHLDKYVLTPNIGFYGGFEWDGNDIFLCDDHDVDTDYDFKVQQRIEDGILKTNIKREYKIKGKTIKELSKIEAEIEQGQVLVYVEGTGYTIPEYKMCKIEEVIEQFNILRGETNDTCGNEKENSFSD